MISLLNRVLGVLYERFFITTFFCFITLHGIVFIVDLHQYHDQLDLFAREHIIRGDAHSFILPVENLLYNGEYTPDYRMPGYILPHGISTLISHNIVAARLLTLFFNTLIYSLALSLFLVAIKQFFGSIWISLACFLWILFFPLTYLASTQCYSENLTLSAFIFCLYFIWLGLSRDRHWYFSVGGLFWAWMIFLRPTSLIFGFVFLVVLVFMHKKNKIVFSTFFKRAILFFVFPAILLSGWTYRNFSKHNAFYPLFVSSNGLYPLKTPSPLYELYSLLNAFGGNNLYWEPGSEITWLTHYASDLSLPNPNDARTPFPSYAFSSAFNEDSLISLRESVIAFNQIKSIEERERQLPGLQHRINQFTLSIKNEKPFVYHILSRIIYFKRFVLDTRTGRFDRKDLLSGSPLLVALNIILKVVTMLMLFSLTLLAPGFVLLLLWKLIISRWLTPDSAMIGMAILFAFFTYLLYPVIKMNEGRYFFISYPFFMACLVVGVGPILDYARKLSK